MENKQLEFLISLIMDDGVYIKMEEKINWSQISESVYTETVDDFFIRKFKNKLNWDIISENIKLKYNESGYFSEEFVEKYKMYLNWHVISSISFTTDMSAFISNYEDYIYFKEVPALTISYLDLPTLKTYYESFDKQQLEVPLRVFRFHSWDIEAEYVEFLLEKKLISEDYLDLFWMKMSKDMFYYPLEFLIKYKDFFNPEYYSYFTITNINREKIDTILIYFKNKLDWKRVVIEYTFSVQLIKKYLYYIYPYRKELLKSKFTTYTSKERKEIKRIFRKESRRRFIHNL